MWSARRWRWGALIFLCVLAVDRPAGATTARRVSLLRSELIADDSDVFLYPGAVGVHRDLVVLNLGIDPFSGDGGILLGVHRLSIGVFAHRVNALGEEASLPEDLSQMLELYDQSGSAVQYEIPAKLFDVLVGWEVARDVHLGLDVGLAHSFNRDREGSGDESALTGEHTYSLSFVMGLTADRPAWRSDVSLELTWNRVRDVQADVLAARSRPQPSFTLAARLILGEDRRLGWGLSALLTRRDYGLELPAAGETWDSSRWVFRLGAGPRVELGGLLVASLEVFGAADLTMMIPDWDPPAGDEDAGGGSGPQTWQRWNVLAPGVRVAAEVRPLRWLVVRAALSDLYRINWQDDTSSLTTSNSFTWSLGLGLAWRSFVFDAAIAHSLFTEGPYFITGENAGLFSRVSVAYDW
jgi:hypothetical protein